MGDVLRPKHKWLLLLQCFSRVLLPLRLLLLIHLFKGVERFIYAFYTQHQNFINFCICQSLLLPPPPPTLSVTRNRWWHLLDASQPLAPFTASPTCLWVCVTFILNIWINKLPVDKSRKINGSPTPIPFSNQFAVSFANYSAEIFSHRTLSRAIFSYK